jgi:signal transduction histidine kinase
MNSNSITTRWFREFKGSWIFATMILALLYFIAGKISFYFSLENSIVTICIFFAEGISLTSAILFGRRAIAGVFIGQFLLAFSGELSLISSIAIAMINSIELLIALYIFKRYKFDKKMSTIRDLRILFLTIIVVLQPFSSFFGNLVLLGASSVDSSNFLESLFSWWFGNIMGQLLVVPMLLAIYNNLRDTTISKIIWVIVLFITINYSFIILLHIDNIALLFSFMIPLVLLVSRYDGLYYAGISVFVIAITSLYSAKIGMGIFANSSMVDNLININFYILAHIVILYTHGISMTEKDIVAKELAQLNMDLVERIDKEVEKNMRKDRVMMQQSRLAQVGETISMIAHQWRQPLNTLSLITEGIYIKYTIGKLDQESIQVFRETTQKQIQQMSDTIDDFRNFFKPEKEKMVFKLESSVNHVYTILNHMLEQESIVINIDIEENIYISGYPNELGQVLVNIINNAKDALVENNLDKKKIININAVSKEDKVSIVIEDNAGGIPDDIIDNIFDPYFSTKDEKNGTGLGLYMSKIIIEDHMNGFLSVSNSNLGASFQIELEEMHKK